ncbi:hypothetical protein N7488_009190 [Penicillium malachiteum]|nr:hypothetical protein N7488_009190 [Penicillium malachiteum]
MTAILLVGYTVPGAVFTVFLILLILILHFIERYRKAYAQFPGPPVKSFWVGNLDQTMTDDVHEKVPPPTYKFPLLVLLA